MKYRAQILILTVLAAFLGAIGTAAGQEESGNADGQQAKVLPDAPDTPTGEREPGFHPTLKLASQISYKDNWKVVGTPNGPHWNIGLSLESRFDFLHRKRHLLTCKLNWQLTFARTPTIERFVKSEDELKLSLSYFHNWLGKVKFGPYISVGLQTAPFPGYDVRTEDTVVKKYDIKGNLISTETVPAKGDIRLTKAFAPVRLKQSLGLFGDLLEKKAIQLHLEAGLAFVKLAVRGGFKLEDNGETTELELKELQDSFEVGGQFKMQLGGVIRKFIEYTLELEIMHPFTHNAETTLSGLSLTNVEFSLKIEFKITKWASLNYTFKISRLPLLSTDWQTRNALLLTLTANIL